MYDKFNGGGGVGVMNYVEQFYSTNIKLRAFEDVLAETMVLIQIFVTKVCINGQGHMTKMAVMAINSKNLHKSSSLEPEGL